MDSQDIIDRAYTILRDRGVGRGLYAQDDDGEGCPTDDPRATKFCSVGALGRAASDLGLTWDSETYRDAVDRIQALVTASLPMPCAITQWNDSATDEQVFALFARATSPTVVDAPLVAA